MKHKNEIHVYVFSKLIYATLFVGTWRIVLIARPLFNQWLFMHS